MTLNFDPTLALKEVQWRPANQWKPRALTSAARVQYVAGRMDQDNHCTAGKDTSYIATQLARHGPKDMAIPARQAQGPQGGKLQAQGPSDGPSAGRGDRAGQVRSAGPPHKVALQPSLLLFGQNGTERAVARCRSADTQSPALSPRGSLSRSSGSPYLQDLHVLHSHPSHHPHPQRRQQQQQQQYHLKQQSQLKQAAGGGTRGTGPRRGPGGERRSDPRGSTGTGAGDGAPERIGRCQPGAATAPFYKAALALMQAQRQRAALLPPSLSPSSSSSRSSSTHTSPSSSPRGSLLQFQLPQPPPHHHHHHHLRHHHSHHHHHYHGPRHNAPHSTQAQSPSRHPYHLGPRPANKSILRQSHAGVEAGEEEEVDEEGEGEGWTPRGPCGGRTAVVRSRPLPPASRHLARSPAAAPSPGEPLTARKKVTFGRNVVVQLQPDVARTGRVLSHVA